MNAQRPDLPEGRYGSQTSRSRPARRRRWPAWAFAAAGIAVAVVLTYLLYLYVGAKPITAERIGFTEKPGNAMEIDLDVRRDDPGRGVVCIVRVRDRSGAETGRKELYIPPGEASVRTTTIVQSGTPPVTADVFGCSYAVPAYLSRTVRPTE